MNVPLMPPPRSRPVDEEAAVAFGIAHFLIRTEVERTTLFRRHLAATVRMVSPLLVELSLMEGVALTEAIGLIRPPQDWPWRPIADYPPGLYRRSMRLQGQHGSGGKSQGAHFRRAFADPGLVIRDTCHPRGRFAIRPCDGMLGFTAALGPSILSAFGSSAVLKLPGQLPETLMLGLPGRQLAQVVDHPLFRDSGYRIARILIDPSDNLPFLVFRVPLVAIEVPGRSIGLSMASGAC